MIDIQGDGGAIVLPFYFAKGLSIGPFAFVFAPVEVPKRVRQK
jgi:hypothetical protein